MFFFRVGNCAQHGKQRRPSSGGVEAGRSPPPRLPALGTGSAPVPHSFCIGEVSPERSEQAERSGVGWDVIALCLATAVAEERLRNKRTAETTWWLDRLSLNSLIYLMCIGPLVDEFRTNHSRHRLKSITLLPTLYMTLYLD